MDIIIETPKGSGIKYKYESALQLFRLLKPLPSGFVFPFDFGFVPGTKGEDGDPFDVLVISEFTGFPGCIMECRMIGCLEVEQTAGKKTISNDRYLAVPEQSRVFENAISIEDIPSTIIMEIESFFIEYINAEGKELKITRRLNAAQAMLKLNEKKE